MSPKSSSGVTLPLRRRLLFLDACGLTDLLGEIVQAAASYHTALDDLDSFEPGAVHQERLLDADAVRDSADGQGLVRAAASAGGYDPLEHLGAFLASLDDSRIDLHRVARADAGKAFFQLVALDQIDDVHDLRHPHTSAAAGGFTPGPRGQPPDGIMAAVRTQRRWSGGYDILDKRPPAKLS